MISIGVRTVLRFTALAGMLFSIWSVLSPTRAMLCAVFLCGIIMLRGFKGREPIVKLCGMIKRRKCVVLGAVLALGIGLRIYYSLRYADLLDLANLRNDWIVLWQKATLFSEGDWPDNKSWTTIAFYAAVIRLFGQNLHAAVVANGVIHALIFLLSFRLGDRVRGFFCGMLFASFVFLSPVFAVLVLRPATEHLYVLFVLVAMNFAVECRRKVGAGRFVLVSAGFAASAYLAMLSRGEGIMLWAVVPFWLLICHLGQWRRMVIVCVPMAFVAILLAGAAMGVNMRTSGVATVFCSNDNLWPRLFGANENTRGRYAWRDKLMIFTRYKRDHPECDWDRTMYRGRFPQRLVGGCPAVLVPYIENEVRRRWSQMGLLRKFEFVCQKERIWQECGWNIALTHAVGNGSGRAFASKVIYDLLPSLVFLLSGVYCGCLMLKRGRCSRRELLLMPVIWMLLVNMVILSIYEVAERYTILEHVLWPLIAAAGVLEKWGRSFVRTVRLPFVG